MIVRHIEDIDHKTGIITVTGIIDTKVLTWCRAGVYNVNIQEFWQYVVENGLNAYCNDSYEPSYGHNQVSGVLYFEEYFGIEGAGVGKTELKNDLTKFLNLKHSKLLNLKNDK